jgi:flagellar basal-body rod protein FlgC
MTIINIAQSGLAASMMRLDASASNVANIDSVGSPASQGSVGAKDSAYQPLAVAQRSVAGGGVSSSLAPARAQSVPRYDPSSPAADSSGMVAAPDVDFAYERVQQFVAAAGFQANLGMVQTADEMAKTAINMLA